LKRLMVGGTLLVTAVVVTLVASGTLASAKVAPTVKAASITVTAGQPIEYAFKLSADEVRPGTVAFKVTNKGLLQYSFEICSGPGNADICFGDSTPALNPGKSVTLTVKLGKGTYEYIGTADDYVTTKGILTVSPNAKATPTTSVAAGTTGKGTKPSGAGLGGATPGGGNNGGGTTPGGGAGAGGAVGNNVGDPVAGASLFQQAGCASCHTLKAAGATGTVGPNLDQVAPDEQTVITNVTFGNAMGMPAFSPQFSSTQIQNIAAYVYKSTH
jgi:mono/diheme cytochrome c family protein/uncharacterized cupredoxin-like copper-binding protein